MTDELWRVKSGDLDKEVRAKDFDGAVTRALEEAEQDEGGVILGALIEVSPLRSDLLYARTDVVLQRLGRWSGAPIEPSSSSLVPLSRSGPADEETAAERLQRAAERYRELWIATHQRETPPVSEELIALGYARGVLFAAVERSGR